MTLASSGGGVVVRLRFFVLFSPFHSSICAVRGALVLHRVGAQNNYNSETFLLSTNSKSLGRDTFCRKYFLLSIMTVFVVW